MSRIFSVKWILFTSIFSFILFFGGHTYPEEKITPLKVDYLEPGIYLVVGVFEFQKNAINYTAYLVKSGKDSARYAFYPPKNYYYVHLGKYENRLEPASYLDQLRAEKGFEEAWVFKAGPYSMPQDKAPEIISQADMDISENPVETEPEPTSTEVSADKLVDNPEPEPEPEPTFTEVSVGKSEPEPELEPEPEPELEPKEEQQNETLPDIANRDEDLGINNQQIKIIRPEGSEDMVGYPVYFNTFREHDFKEIKGKIEVINPDKLQQIKIIDAHEWNVIPEGVSQSGNVELICDIFGYKKVQHDFNINNPINEETDPYLSYEDSTLVVDFQLQRYTKGDLVTMYNVYFFKDAAIMRPESQYELSQLIEMLKENTDYEIMIHGHTNGNNSGPIITLKEDTDQFFSRNAPSNEGYGSAKKLSQARADIIKRYLVDQGISESRMKAKGWGGKKAIYKKFDPLAYKNVRVEIEILAD